MIKFYKKNLEIIEKEIFDLSKKLNLSCKKIALEKLYKLPQYAIKNDSEHNYNDFFAAYKINYNQYFLLFKNKLGKIYDAKWLGYDASNDFSDFLSILYVIMTKFLLNGI
jgi:hypothetical protein